MPVLQTNADRPPMPARNDAVARKPTTSSKPGQSSSSRFIRRLKSCSTLPTEAISRSPSIHHVSQASRSQTKLRAIPPAPAKNKLNNRPQGSRPASISRNKTRQIASSTTEAGQKKSAAANEISPSGVDHQRGRA